MPTTESRIVTRRLLLKGGTLAAATGIFGARGVSALQATPAASADGWTFTDDKGVIVSLPERPLRIVADVNAAAPLWDYGIRPIAVFGWNATETGDFGPAGGNVDPATVDVIGDATETINIEKLVALEPDLIVTITWEPENPIEYWSIMEDVVDRVKQVAPIVAISATGSADINTERFTELAGALGADLGSAAVADEKAEYEAALANFSSVATAKSDLVVLWLYVDAADIIYVANPSDWADLSLYGTLGLNSVLADAPKFAYWEELSLEQALKYPADVVFNSTRPGTLTVDEIKAHSTLGQHPAVKAGQIGLWNQDFIMSYAGMTKALNDTIATIESASKVI